MPDKTVPDLSEHEIVLECMGRYGVMATCSCGWDGKERGSLAMANEDADEHLDEVEQNA